MTVCIINVVGRSIVSALVSFICYYCSCLVNPTSELPIQHIIIIIIIIVIIIIITIITCAAPWSHRILNLTTMLRVQSNIEVYELVKYFVRMTVVGKKSKDKGAAGSATNSFIRFEWLPLLTALLVLPISG